MCWYVRPLTYSDALMLCIGITTSFAISFGIVAEAEAATAWGETLGLPARAVSDATPTVTCTQNVSFSPARPSYKVWVGFLCAGIPSLSFSNLTVLIGRTNANFWHVTKSNSVTWPDNVGLHTKLTSINGSARKGIWHTKSPTPAISTRSLLQKLNKNWAVRQKWNISVVD